MKSIRRAVIDIGTNSVKLLVAEVEGRHVAPLLESSDQTRLGKGFYQSHQLQPESIGRTAKAVAWFAEKARQLEAASIRVIATSVVRDALNRAELLRAIEEGPGLKVHVITGQEEARLAWQGVRTHPSLENQALTIVEVGGGSTQIITGSAEAEPHYASFNIGAVRLYEYLGQADPVGEDSLARCLAEIRAFLEEKVSPALLQHEGGPPQPGRDQLVGIGGTSSVLASLSLGLRHFDRERIEAATLKKEEVRRQLRRLWNLSVAERRRLRGLPPNRADIILTGVAIYEGFMSAFGFRDLRVSTRGLRFAAVLEAP